MAKRRLVYHDVTPRVERRTGDRRVTPGTGPGGVERRQGERREAREKLDGLTVAAILVGLLLVAIALDAWLWDSYYWKHFVYELNDTAASTRTWTDDLWK